MDRTQWSPPLRLFLLLKGRPLLRASLLLHETFVMITWQEVQIQDCAGESHHSLEPGWSSQTGATVPPKASCQKHPQSKPWAAQMSTFLLYKPRSYFKNCWPKCGLYHNQMSIPTKLGSRGWKQTVSTYFNSDATNSLRRGLRREQREQQRHRRNVDNFKSLTNLRQQNIISLTNKSY